jgi:alpha-glucosidase (family GH31 glycosyl hydrolase)
MPTQVSRRALLGGCAAGLAELLLTRRVRAASVRNPLSGAPGELDLSLAALSPAILRISVAPVSARPPAEELGVVAQSRASALLRKAEPVTAELPWGKYRIGVAEDPLRITVSRANGDVCQQIQFDPDTVAVEFILGKSPVFGLGEGLPRYDLRGARYEMKNGQGTSNLRLDGSRVPIPWLISAAGWGLFVGQPSGIFDLSGDNGVFRPVEASATRNVYLMVGDTPEEILRGYAELTGFPHLPPLWALGYQQSHRTLGGRDEVMTEARTFREKKLPCDTLIYLGTGFCPSGWNTGHGSFTFNENVFPDPKAMIAQLHEEHFRVVLHVVPPGDFHGTLHDSGVAVNAPGDAVPYWRQHMPVEEAGVDGWWPDEGDRLSVYARLQRNRLYWDGPLKAHPDRRPFALHRNGYAGIQRYGWLWSGDIDSSWDTLAAQVRNGINVGLSGIPWWGTDTGGFVPTLELTPELYIRWFQFSAFCPLFRSHGRAWKLRLPWGWDLGNPGPLEGSEKLGPDWPPPGELHDAQVEEVCREYLNLRYRLLPFLYSSAAQTHTTGLPLIRPVWFADRTDQKALSRDDEYLFGDSFLVAPVLKPGARQRSLYLPAGQWWDYWSGEATEGGREIARVVDLKTLPLYVKAGAIVPFGPVRQYAEEPMEEPLTLWVYPGADGQFALYEDDGESFRYPRGEFTRLDCEWRDGEGTLTVRADPKGELPAGRKMRVCLAGSAATTTITVAGAVTVAKL